MFRSDLRATIEWIEDLSEEQQRKVVYGICAASSVAEAMLQVRGAQLARRTVCTPPACVALLVNSNIGMT